MNMQANIFTQNDLSAMTARLAASRNVLGKTDIADACAGLELDASTLGRPGDDCAALPDGRGGWLLYAIEGFIPGFVEADPWFAGWCGVMVNISDVLAMGGTPAAIVNAIWAPNSDAAAPVLAGMAAASQAYNVPIVGGHTNLGADTLNLSVSVLGQATHLMTSFDAAPDDVLICAVDQRGAYRAPFDNWQAALDAPHQRLRGDAAFMAELAATGTVTACKDISQAGIPGTALMLAECSGVGVAIDLDVIPLPEDVPLEQWLRSFPSFGFLITTKPTDAAAIIADFTARGISAAAIGKITEGTQVTLHASGHHVPFWDHKQNPYMSLLGKKDHANA